jgi:ribosomal protein L31
MWNYVGGIITPNAGSVARACATWAGRNITLVLYVDTDVVSCISIGFVDWLCGTRVSTSKNIQIVIWNASHPFWIPAIQIGAGFGKSFTDLDEF